MRKGFTLIEVLVSVGLGVLLIIAAYDLLSDVSRTTFQTRGRITAIARERTIQDQLRYYIQNTGLGVPSGTQKIVHAGSNILALNLNSDYFSYTTGEYFLAADTPTTVAVQQVKETEIGGPVVVLSFSGEQISNSPVLQAYDTGAGQLTLLNSGSLWIAKGNYIGHPHKTHTFTLSNNRLILTKGTATGVLADGVESFDIAFLYDPPWRDSNGNGSIDDGEDESPVWCYDASGDDPAGYDPDGINRILDTDLSGAIDYEDDQNADSLIDGTLLGDATDTDGNGRVNGLPFEQASVIRIWVLVRSDRSIGATGVTKYLVGRRILSYVDERQRRLSYFDIKL